MGDIYVTIRLRGPRGTTQLHALVDTCATFTKITRSEAERIGLEIERETSVQLSTGQFVRRGLDSRRPSCRGCAELSL